MTITLTSKELDEAVNLWLSSQGFTTDRYDISTRTISGRSDGGLGTRIEATLEPISQTVSSELVKQIYDNDVAAAFTAHGALKRFGQGHADE